LCVGVTHHLSFSFPSFHLLLCQHREAELQSAAFGANEASCHLNELRGQVDQLSAATRSAEETAAAATGVQSWLQGWQQEVPAFAAIKLSCRLLVKLCKALMTQSIILLG
jgi:hypothetical protein